MKKILISLMFGLALTVGIQTMANYTLSSSDLTFVTVLEKKINELIVKKGETQRQKFITILTTLSNNPNAPEKPKAIIQEILRRLLASRYDYGYVPLSGTNTSSTGLIAIRQEILKLVNQERTKVGLKSLTMNEKLNTAAQLHGKDMADKSYFSHTNKDGKTVADRVQVQGYNYSFVGENIARNQRTATEVMTSRMNSPGHKANILNKDYKEIGIGLQNRYRVQNFGTQQ